jgi:hypothetical protein
MIWKGITEGVYLIYKGLRYLWEPACKRCEDQETACLAKSDPCRRQRDQKNNRLISLAIVIGVPLIVFLLVSAVKKDTATREREKAIEQLLIDSKKPK